MRRWLAAVLLAFPASAAASPSAVDSQDLAAERGSAPIVRYSYANDFFVGTDEYYTQGMGLTVFDPASGWGFVVRHDGFTPTSLRHDEAIVGDRPFASYLYSGGVKVWRDPRPGGWWTITSEVDLGLIGRAAGGQWEQTTIHRATGNLLPHGWSNQIRNDLVLDAGAQGDAVVVSGRAGDLRLHVDGTLGTLYTNAAAGARARLGAQRFFLDAAAEARLVGYDATLEGGLVDRTSPYTIAPSRIDRIVPRAELGATLDLGRFVFAARRVQLGREFEGGRPHGWVEIGLAVRL